MKLAVLVFSGETEAMGHTYNRAKRFKTVAHVIVELYKSEICRAGRLESGGCQEADFPLGSGNSVFSLCMGGGGVFGSSDWFWAGCLICMGKRFWGDALKSLPLVPARVLFDHRPPVFGKDKWPVLNHLGPSLYPILSNRLRIWR